MQVFLEIFSLYVSEIWFVGLFSVENFFPSSFAFLSFSFLFLSSHSSPCLVVYFSSTWFLWLPVQSQLTYRSSGLLPHSDSKNPANMSASCLVKLPPRHLAFTENIYSSLPSQKPYFGWSLPASKLEEVHQDFGFCYMALCFCSTSDPRRGTEEYIKHTCIVFKRMIK